ncbi:hypothetical protein AZE42_00519 [Rhizopogon vesiculosus]|uniref:Uncharacterized protein n=1 Tax=Rhizopogon vesiculosus TaxID=180088 RepID=A0A1J8QPZ6_9AGAM|nr:hypothetical protein AZE42_00519 [Rhizopogon vesiculosus]
MTGFSVRNAYYLRVSASSVIPLYLYLDERHVDWMSDRILQHVLVDLRPLVLPKLQAERDIHFGAGASSGKKGAVDVHRGETYQFAFFFQKTEPHSVIIKTRSFVPAPARPPSPPKVNTPPPQPGKSKSRNGKRKIRASGNQTAQPASGHKKQKTKGRSWARSDDEEEEEDQDVISLSDDDDEEERDVISFSDDDSDIKEMERTATRRSERKRRVPVGGYREDDEDDVSITPAEPLDVEMGTPAETTLRDEAPAGVSDPNLLVMGDSAVTPTTVKQEDSEMSLGTTLDSESIVVASEPEQPFMELDEGDVKKHKLVLKLKYQGFNIFGRCLCVVVEPWPPIRFATRAPSVMPLTNEILRGSTIAPPDFVHSNSKQRDRTPLFLPELDRGRSQTPAPFPLARTLPPVPLFNDAASQSDDDGYGSDDLMVFSQALNAAGGMHVAAADDDDEMDGAVLFGDADEVREFS